MKVVTTGDYILLKYFQNFQSPVCVLIPDPILSFLQQCQTKRQAETWVTPFKAWSPSGRLYSPTTFYATDWCWWGFLLLVAKEIIPQA